MDEEFEKGKQYLVEGLEALLAMYDPILKLIWGIKMLGVSDSFFGNPEVATSLEKYDQLKLVLDSWLSDIRQARDKAELLQSVEKNGEFMMRLLGD